MGGTPCEPSRSGRSLGGASSVVRGRGARRILRHGDDTEESDMALLSMIPPLERPRRQVALARIGTALAATSLGALAVGALAVGAIAVRRLAIKSARFQRLEIDELVVGGRTFQVPG
jgi:hypothetical protein